MHMSAPEGTAPILLALNAARNSEMVQLLKAHTTKSDSSQKSHSKMTELTPMFSLPLVKRQTQTDRQTQRERERERERERPLICSSDYPQTSYVA